MTTVRNLEKALLDSEADQALVFAVQSPESIPR